MVSGNGATDDDACDEAVDEKTDDSSTETVDDAIDEGVTGTDEDVMVLLEVATEDLTDACVSPFDPLLPHAAKLAVNTTIDAKVAGVLKGYKPFFKNTSFKNKGWAMP